MNTCSNIEQFANSLVRKPIDPVRLEVAKRWYNMFAGKHAVPMDDRELVQIYDELH